MPSPRGMTRGKALFWWEVSDVCRKEEIEVIGQVMTLFETKFVELNDYVEDRVIKS